MPLRLGLATPLPCWWQPAGARLGLLLRGGDVLAAAGVDTVALDKTGTITEETQGIGVAVDEGQQWRQLTC